LVKAGPSRADDGDMADHHHHWVLIDGYTNAYFCCDCGASRGEKRAVTAVRPTHRGFLVPTARKLAARRHSGAGSRRAA
jgi:hypothetical protein